MKSYLFFTFFVVIFLVSVNWSYSDDRTTIVVTANKIDTGVNKIGDSVVVITKKEIEERNSSSIVELLRTIPSLNVVQTGGFGGNVSVFIRGTDSAKSLIMVDGMEINDPMNPSRGANLANFELSNVDRIEIIKGSQSTIYGSDAMGGVINIITKKGSKEKHHDYTIYGGSFRTQIKTINDFGGNERYNYSISITDKRTNGFSSAGEKYGNSEKDGYENLSILANYQSNPSDNLKLDFSLRYMNSKTDLDNGGGKGQDDVNYKLNSRELYFKSAATILSNNEIWEQKWSISLSKHNRIGINGLDLAHPSDSIDSRFNSKFMKFEWQNNFYLKNNVLTLGIEHQREKGESYWYSTSSWGPFTSIFPEKLSKTTGFYLQDYITPNRRMNITTSNLANTQ